MHTITIHLDSEEIDRFRTMKAATGMTWTQIVFATLEGWEADHDISN